MKRLLEIFIPAIPILLSYSAIFAQAPDTVWTRTYEGNRGASVQQTTDGGYIITGYAGFILGGDALLIKTDSNGDTLWTRTFPQSGGHSRGESVQQTLDGGYIIAGTMTIPLMPPGRSVLLIKTDSNGDTLWTRYFGRGDSSVGVSVQQTTDGGYIITGTCEIYVAGPPWGHLYLIKTDSDGDSLWTRTFSTITNRGYSVQQTMDGGYIVTGFTVSNDDGNSDIWLVKTDSNGDSLWTRTFGGNDEDCGYSVQQTTDGGYIVTGYTESYGAGSSDIWLVKTDSNGDSLWTRTFGGSESDQGYSVQQTTDGGYIVAGYSQSYGAGYRDVWMIKTDSEGDSLWSCTVGGVSDDEASSVQQTTDGGYIITGTTFSYGADGDNVWLIRFDSETPVKTEPELRLPDEFRLYPNFPNPFNATTTIKYSLPEAGRAKIEIYDLLGRSIETLVNEEKQAGQHQAVWDASDCSSGVFFYKIQAGEFVETKKMLLLK